MFEHYVPETQAFLREYRELVEKHQRVFDLIHTDIASIQPQHIESYFRITFGTPETQQVEVLACQINEAQEAECSIVCNSAERFEEITASVLARLEDFGYKRECTFRFVQA